MRRLISALLLSTSVASAAPAPVLLDDGMAAYTSARFVAARRAFHQLADQGSAIGETMLATMLAHGQGGRRDAAAAVGYYFRAAQRGYAPAQLALSRVLLRGEGVAVDRHAALVWARLAQSRGDARLAAAARAAASAIGGVPDPVTVDRDVADWRPWPRGG